MPVPVLIRVAVVGVTARADEDEREGRRGCLEQFSARKASEIVCNVWCLLALLTAQHMPLVQEDVCRLAMLRRRRAQVEGALCAERSSGRLTAIFSPAQYLGKPAPAEVRDVRYTVLCLFRTRANQWQPYARKRDFFTCAGFGATPAALMTSVSCALPSRCELCPACATAPGIRPCRPVLSTSLLPQWSDVLPRVNFSNSGDVYGSVSSSVNARETCFGLVRRLPLRF